MLKAVFFDLDGTLLPMDETVFTKGYFKFLIEKVAPLGYEPNKLVDVIWKGTYLMVQNDGKRTNEEVFWDYFLSVYGKERMKDKAVFNDFYRNEFSKAAVFCQKNPLAKDIVSFVRFKGLEVVLSTNPFFPRDGQRMRLSFIGLEDTDFDYVTDYSNSSFCKPNPMYFKSLLEKRNLKPEEVVLFGNNTYEDGDCASCCGIKTYLVRGFIIHSDKSKGTYPEIDMSDIKGVIEEEMKARK